MKESEKLEMSFICAVCGKKAEYSVSQWNVLYGLCENHYDHTLRKPTFYKVKKYVML
jgi:hypothetical protein